jgi:hypothetical protein
VVALQRLTASGTGNAIRGVAAIRGFALVAARATFMAKTVAGAARTSRLAMLFAPALYLGAAAAMARRLEVPEATASDNRPAIENGERYRCPHHGRPAVAFDKSSWSDTEHDSPSSETLTANPLDEDAPSQLGTTALLLQLFGRNYAIQ